MRCHRPAVFGLLALAALTGAWALAVAFVLVLGFVAVATAPARIALGRPARTTRSAPRLSDRLAERILDVEDRVRVYGTTEVRAHFDQACATYLAASDRFSARGMPAPSDHDLRLALWRLDAAQALLDDAPLPPRPQSRIAVRERPGNAHRHRCGW